ncbi:G0/G1 switch protein 2 [Menidia menidia]
MNIQRSGRTYKRKLDPETGFFPQAGSQEQGHARIRPDNLTLQNLDEMEGLRELIPFCRELLGQRPGRGLLKVYLVGSVLAVVGTAIGMVEVLCQPFISVEPLDADLLLMSRLLTEIKTQPSVRGLDIEEEKQEEEIAQDGVTQTQDLDFFKTQRFRQRTSSIRQHAS